MITFGIDVFIMAMAGLVNIVLMYWWCRLACIAQDEGDGMLKGAAITVVVMLVGYVIMAHVLDWIVAM